MPGQRDRARQTTAENMRRLLIILINIKYAKKNCVRAESCVLEVLVIDSGGGGGKRCRGRKERKRIEVLINNLS